MRSFVLMTALVCVALAGAAHAAEIMVSSNISTSTTWTSNNTYNLQKQIYVLPGATLTIQAGTVLASTTNLGGSLAVCKGGRIYVQGTQASPVIMTSKADVATWVGGNPETGTWRTACNEWGNLTMMGDAYISEDIIPENKNYPDPGNYALMEGLEEEFPGDTKVRYGGGNDDDNSGTISYLSLRYGGKVIGFNNELNGLSMGGIGRETDVHHIDIMNNVDDGIETWGGTYNIKYFNIWNIGDDSFDVDQGWRGRAQFGLIVQGYSVDAKQGSGVGDNCFETDGAEQSDYQPLTTACIYNCTVIGQPHPNGGDHGTAWRDGARVQYRNCIFMELGEKLVKFDNVDGDGGLGYGYNGAMPWADVWTTAWNGAPARPNDPQNHGIAWADFYQGQFSGKLAEIKDSVFYPTTLDLGDAPVNLLNTGYNNVSTDDLPVQTLTRGAPFVTTEGKTMIPVAYLDPRPANDALTSVAWAPANGHFAGFFNGAHYRGAFAPGLNWLSGWTASQAFGFTPSEAWCDLGHALQGYNGDPYLSGTGTCAGGSAVTVTLSNAKPSSTCGLLLGLTPAELPYAGGIVGLNLLLPPIALPTGTGTLAIPTTWPAGLPSGFQIFFQYIVVDSAAPQGKALSNVLVATCP